MLFRNPLVFAAALVLAAAPAFAQEAKNAKAVAATVNGKPIYEEQVKQYTSTPGGPTREQVIGELVNQELVLQDAVAKKLDKDPAVQRELEQLRKRVLMTAAVQKAMAKMPITDEQIAAEYEKRKDQLAHKEYKARHILVDSKEKAEKAIKDLEAGGKFADIASRDSSDPGSAKNGGDLGWFPADKMVPSFGAALRSLQKGEYTKSPVQTQFGWHVILLEDVRDVPAPALADIKEQVRGALQQQNIAKYLAGLRAKAKITETKK